MTSRAKGTLSSKWLGIALLMWMSASPTPAAAQAPDEGMRVFAEMLAGMHLSVGAGVTTTNFTEQFEKSFRKDFGLEFNPQYEFKKKVPAFNLSIDFGVFEHKNHRNLDLRLGGGVTMNGRQNYLGTATGPTLRLTNLGESMIDEFYLRIGPSFKVGNRARVWPFYQKGIIRTMYKFEDELVRLPDGVRLAGTTLEDQGWDTVHATVGAVLFIEVCRLLSLGVEYRFSNYPDIFPLVNPGRGRPGVHQNNMLINARFLLNRGQ